MELVEKIKHNADLTVKMFSQSHNIQLNYDEEAVKFLDDFIENSGRKFSEKQQEQLINFLGSFLGECIRHNYGGKWEEINGGLGVRLNDNNVLFPFNKVRKQFKNGSEDSIHGFYRSFPVYFREIIKKRKENNNKAIEP